MGWKPISHRAENVTSEHVRAWFSCAGDRERDWALWMCEDWGWKAGFGCNSRNLCSGHGEYNFWNRIYGLESARQGQWVFVMFRIPRISIWKGLKSFMSCNFMLFRLPSPRLHLPFSIFLQLCIFIPSPGIWYPLRYQFSTSFAIGISVIQGRRDGFIVQLDLIHRTSYRKMCVFKGTVLLVF